MKNTKEKNIKVKKVFFSVGAGGGVRRLSWQLIWLVLWPSLALHVHTEVILANTRLKPPSLLPLVEKKKAFQLINAFSWWFKAVSSHWLTIMSPWNFSVLDTEQTKGDTEREQTEDKVWKQSLILRPSKQQRHQKWIIYALFVCVRACVWVRAQYVWEVLFMEFSTLRQKKTVKDTDPNWEMFVASCYSD